MIKKSRRFKNVPDKKIEEVIRIFNTTHDNTDSVISKATGLNRGIVSGIISVYLSEKVIGF